MYIATNFYSGLGNRLYESCILREIANYYNMKVLLNWPEVESGAISFPNTEYIKPNMQFIDFTANLPNVNSIKDLNLDRNRNYRFVDGWNFRRDLSNEVGRIHDIEFSDAYKDHAKQFLDLYRPSPIFGMHIRRGDFATYDGTNLGNNCVQSPMNWYTNIGHQILKKYPSAKFFIATNGSDEEIESVRNELPTISIPSTQEFLQHIIEFYILSILPLFLLSPSTFSLIAKDIGVKKVGIWPKDINQDVTEELKLLETIL